MASWLDTALETWFWRCNGMKSNVDLDTGFLSPDVGMATCCLCRVQGAALVALRRRSRINTHGCRAATWLSQTPTSTNNTHPLLKSEVDASAGAAGIKCVGVGGTNRSAAMGK